LKNGVLARRKENAVLGHRKREDILRLLTERGATVGVHCCAAFDPLRTSDPSTAVTSPLARAVAGIGRNGKKGKQGEKSGRLWRF